MTIAAAYVTSEGVVLGADSTVTIDNGVQLMNHNQKVFEVGQDSRFGLCTFGAGGIGAASHRTIAARLGDWVAGQQKPPQVVDVASELEKVVMQLASPDPDFQVGYYVGGQDPDRSCSCFMVRASFDPSAQTVVATKQQLGVGANFSGQPRFFTRLFHGIDFELWSHLKKALAPMLDSSNPAKAESQMDSILQVLLPNVMARGWVDLPIRDAIDYIHSILLVTIKSMKFRFGVPVCGGPVEIAVITTDRNFRWVLHKGFDSAIFDHLNIRTWTR